MKRILTALLPLLLAACVPIWQQKPTATPEMLWQQRLQQQAELTDWAFRGRTAITQNREGWNAGVDWVQQQKDFQIKLSGPFSQGGAELDGDVSLVTLTLDNGEKYTASSPEKLIYDAMGLQLPVSALRDWVRGVPFAQLPVEDKTLDEQGRLLTLKQAGWEIEFKQYMPFQGYSMPAKVFMRYPQLSIRLLVSDWRKP